MGGRVRGGERLDPSNRAFAISLSVLVLGIVSCVLIAIPGAPPLFGKDLDSDGISDHLEHVTEVVDHNLDEDGQWVPETTGYTSSFNIPLISFMLIASTLAIPTAVYLYSKGRDGRRSRDVESAERSGMHDTVRRIASFLEVNPSLISAIRYAHGSLPRGEGGSLGQLLWSARSKGVDFREVYTRFRRDWSAVDPLIGKALADLESAENEPTPLEVSLSSRRAMDELTEGARREMTRYANSLQGPTTALFALGVLLPVLLATMVPVSGIGGSSGILLGFLLWFLIPAGILYFGGRIIDSRPRFRSGERKGIGATRISIAPLGVTLLLAGMALSAVALSGLAGWGLPDIPWPGLDSKEGAVLTLIWGLSLTGSSIVMSFGMEVAASRKRIATVEALVPDLLQGIGSAVSEGVSFEGAVQRALSRSVLSNDDGPVHMTPGMDLASSDLPAPLDNAFRAARYFSRSGAATGGRAIRALGNHLRGLLALEDEISQRIDSTIGQMEITSSMFAPLMIGASVGIFQLLDPDMMSEGMAVLGGGTGSMESSTFILISGVYLLILSAVSSITISRLRSGSKRGGWERAPMNMLRATFSFTIGAVCALMLLA